MGHASKQFGQVFETMFKAKCRSIPGMAVTRFPDGCRRVHANKIVSVKTPCDWIITYGGQTALIDTKTVQTHTFAYSKLIPHQVESLVEHEAAGAKAGYVIWYRKNDDVIFVASSYMITLMNKVGSIRVGTNGLIYLGKSASFQPKLIFGNN